MNLNKAIIDARAFDALFAESMAVLLRAGRPDLFRLSTV
jgi:hypothetical protein